MNRNKTLKIEKMTCVMCSASVEKALRKTPGVISAAVNFATSKAEIVYDDEIAKLSDIFTAVKKAGYKAVDTDSADKSGGADKFKLIISGAASILLLYVSMGHMINLPFFFSPENKPGGFVITQLVLTLPAMICGWSMYYMGFKNLFTLKPNMDSLVAVSTTAAFAFSMYASVRVLAGETAYAHNLYFESVAVIITLIMFGKFLEHRSLAKTGKAVEKLINLTPKEAVRIKDGAEEVVPVESLLPGDVILLKPGDSVCVDGIVTEGESAVNESMLTGESIPADKSEGSTLFAGTVNLNGTLKFRASKVGSETVLAGIIKTVETAQNTKAPIARLADKVAGIFTPAVMAIALISAIIWWIAKDFGFAVEVFVSVLVIACPCALGLATPTAIIVASGKGASMGILYKNAEAIQKLAGIKTVVFDKTGTLTTGRPAVREIVCLGGLSEEELLRISASVESLSSHPISKAITEYNKQSLYEVKNFKYFSGSGISAEIGNRKIRTGKPEFILNTNDYDGILGKLENEGRSVIAVEIDGKPEGFIALSDTLKPGAEKMIADLKSMGIKTVMLSGDGEKSVQNAAKTLGIDEYYFRVTPNEKFDIVNKLRSEAKTAMAGDGINDASALASADIGIGFSDGTDISIEAAEIIIMNGSVESVSNAVKLSRFAMRVIKQNLFWAFIYNSIGLAFAAGVFYPLLNFLLSPMIGALAMSLSSVSVVGNALRINTFKGSKNTGGKTARM